MGGIVCAIPRQAVLRFESVPTSHKDQREFDEQIRTLFANPVIANAVGIESPRAQEACDILASEHFTQSDRVALFEIVESLYES